MEEGERDSLVSSVHDSCGPDSFRTVESDCEGESSVDPSDSEHDANGWILRSAVKPKGGGKEVVVEVHEPQAVESPPPMQHQQHPRRGDAGDGMPKTSWVIESVQPCFRVAEEVAPQVNAAPPSAAARRREQQPDVSQLRYLAATSSAKRRQDSVSQFIHRRTQSPQTPGFRFGSWHKPDARSPPQATPTARRRDPGTPTSGTPVRTRQPLHTPKRTVTPRRGRAAEAAAEASLSATATPRRGGAAATSSTPAARRARTPPSRRVATPEARAVAGRGIGGTGGTLGGGAAQPHRRQAVGMSAVKRVRSSFSSAAAAAAAAPSRQELAAQAASDLLGGGGGGGAAASQQQRTTKGEKDVGRQKRAPPEPLLLGLAEGRGSPANRSSRSLRSDGGAREQDLVPVSPKGSRKEYFFAPEDLPRSGSPGGSPRGSPTGSPVSPGAGGRGGVAFPGAVVLSRGRADDALQESLGTSGTFVHHSQGGAPRLHHPTTSPKLRRRKNSPAAGQAAEREARRRQQQQQQSPGAAGASRRRTPSSGAVPLQQRTFSPRSFREISFGQQGGRPQGHMARPQAFLNSSLVGRGGGGGGGGDGTPTSASGSNGGSRPVSEARQRGGGVQRVEGQQGGRLERTAFHSAQGYTSSEQEGAAQGQRRKPEAQQRQRRQQQVEVEEALPEVVEVEEVAAAAVGVVSSGSRLPSRLPGEEEGVAAAPSPGRERRGSWAARLAEESIQLAGSVAEAREGGPVPSTLQLQLVEATVRLSFSRDELMSRYEISQVCMHEMLTMPGDCLWGSLSPADLRRRHELQDSYETELHELRTEHVRYVSSEEALLASIDPTSTEAEESRVRLRRGASRHYSQLAALRAEHTVMQSEIWNSLPVVLGEQEFHSEIAKLDRGSEVLENELDMVLGDDDDDDDEEDAEDDDAPSSVSSVPSSREVDPPARSSSVEAGTTESTPPTHSPQQTAPHTPGRNLSALAQLGIATPPGMSESLLLQHRVLLDRVLEDEGDARRFLMEEEACVVARLFNEMHTSLLHLILNRGRQDPPQQQQQQRRNSVTIYGHYEEVAEEADRGDGSPDRAEFVKTLPVAMSRASPSPVYVRHPSSRSSSERGRSWSSGHPGRAPPPVPHVDSPSIVSVSPQRRARSRSPSAVSSRGGSGAPRPGGSPPHGVRDIRGRTPPHLAVSPSLSFSPAMTLSPSLGRDDPWGAAAGGVGVGVRTSDPALSTSRGASWAHQVDSVSIVRVESSGYVVGGEQQQQQQQRGSSPQSCLSLPQRDPTPPAQFAEYSIGVQNVVVPTDDDTSPGVSPQPEVPRWKQLAADLQTASSGPVRMIFEKLQIEKQKERSTQREARLRRLRDEHRAAAESDREVIAIPPARGLLGGGSRGNSPLRARSRRGGASTAAASAAPSVAPSMLDSVPVWITGEGFRGSSELGYRSRTPSPPVQRKPFCSASPAM